MKVAKILAVVLILGLAATAIAETASRALQITEVTTATRVQGREIDAATSFERNGGFIFCVVRLENPSGGGNAIYVSFEPATGEPTAGVRGIELRIPARYRYRTVARTGSTMAAGPYRCVVRDREGVVLSHTDFTVTEPSE